jgi:hypothetical protein
MIQYVFTFLCQRDIAYGNSYALRSLIILKLIILKEERSQQSWLFFTPKS